MFGLGVPELIIILVMFLIVFGVGKLPEIGGGLSKAIRNFKTATKEVEDNTGENPEEIDQSINA